MKKGKHMILATVRIVIPPSKRKEALQILRLTANESRIHPGCLSCRIYVDIEENNVLMFEERWGSQEDLERHLCSDAYYKVLLVMEMATKHPEVNFSEIAHTTGMEMVEKLRMGPLKTLEL